MSLKKIFSTKKVLLVLLLLAAVVAVPVSATDTPLFSIPGKTTVVFPSDGASTFSAVDYGPLSIPNSFVEPTSEKAITLGSANIPKYNLITFNNPIPVRSDSITLPISIHGILYTAILNKCPIDSRIEGMDGYFGTISELDDSRIVLVISRENVITGSISVADEYLVISPAQNHECAENSTFPLHIVYSENDLYLPSDPVSFCGTRDLDESYNYQFSGIASEYSSNLNPVTLDILFVTDQEYPTRVAYWQNEAYRLLVNTYMSFTNNDALKISMDIAGYDSSKASLLSNSAYRITNPIQAVQNVYSTSDLNSAGADVLIYLGGNDQYNAGASNTGHENKVGEVNDFPPSGRFVWIQMVADQRGGNYDASTHATGYCIIHELGHIFDAQHDNTNRYSENGNVKFNVMYDKYLNSDVTGYAFAQPAITRMVPQRGVVTTYV